MPSKKREAQRPSAADPPGPAFRARLEAQKQESTLQLLFKAARLLDEEAVRRVASKPGRQKLRRSHMALLPHLDLEGTRVTDLAGRLGVTKQAVSQLVDDLEAMGVLERVADPEDARARRVMLTKAGREGIFEGLAVLRGLEKELEESVGGTPMQHLRRALISILGTLPAS